jgi:hypothetical protein
MTDPNRNLKLALYSTDTCGSSPARLEEVKIVLTVQKSMMRLTHDRVQ